MFVPDSGNEIRTVRVRCSRLLVAVGLIGVLGAVALGLLATGAITPPGLPSPDLESENALLRQRLASLELDIGRLQDRVHEADQLEERMRLLAALEPIDDEVRLMGVGGPDFSAQDPLYRLDRDLAAGVQRARRSTDELLRRCEIQRHSFLEILESLEQRRDHWAHIPSITPVSEGRITSGFGRRTDPFTHRRALHRGVDISARRGTPIVATADGKVVFAGKNSNYGLTIKIDHGNGLETLYAHVLDLKVKKGQQVERGQEIARVGSSGKSTAPHVHYEVRVDKRVVNPRRYMLKPGIVID